MGQIKLVAILKTSLAEAQGIIDELGLDAKARRVGRYIAVWGPFVDEMGKEGIAEVARSKKLPLVEVREMKISA